MSAPLAEVLLRIAAAVAADGGTGVRKALETALREAAPFDAGEVVFVRAHGEHVHLPLGGGERPLLGADLVTHVLAHSAPYRVDDWPDALPFAETHEILRARDLRSTLVLPFRFEATGTQALAGVLGVARAHGWAYVGASLPLLVPLAGMAGLAVDRALTLSALAQQAKALDEKALRPAPRRCGSRATPIESRPTTSARSSARRATPPASCCRGRRPPRNGCSRPSAHATIGHEQAASLRARLGEQKGELQSLQRAVAGARETAAAAADLAEAREVRAHELEAHVRTLEHELREARDRAETVPVTRAEPLPTPTSEPSGPPPAPSGAMATIRTARPAARPLRALNDRPRALALEVGSGRTFPSTAFGAAAHDRRLLSVRIE